MTSTEHETPRGLRLGGLRLVRTHQEDGTLSPELLTNLGFPRDRGRREVSGGALLLAGASVLLAANAAAMGIVSWHAQYAFVDAVKHQHAASALEALGLDAGAVIFAVLGIALARLGRSAGIERVLVVACAAGSCGMNLLGADLGSLRSVAVYVMPPVLFAAGSDRLIAVIRQAAMGRREDDASQRSAWRSGGVAALYLLRFAVAPPSTLTGVRQALLAATPLPAAAGELPATALHSELPPPPAGPEETAPDPDLVLARCPGCTQDIQMTAFGLASHRNPGGEVCFCEPEQPYKTKTEAFLARVTDAHGPLAGIDPEKVGRISADLHDELNEGSARTALRAAVLAAQAGGAA